jgi:hypothetical protein
VRVAGPEDRLVCVVTAAVVAVAVGEDRIGGRLRRAGGERAQRDGQPERRKQPAGTREGGHDQGIGTRSIAFEARVGIEEIDERRFWPAGDGRSGSGEADQA